VVGITECSGQQPLMTLADLSGHHDQRGAPGRGQRSTRPTIGLSAMGLPVDVTVYALPVRLFPRESHGGCRQAYSVLRSTAIATSQSTTCQQNSEGFQGKW